tara:strand:+ start:150 stop:404 length:255 start_codon:yes stop_codon:yes gene_type:complete
LTDIKPHNTVTTFSFQAAVKTGVLIVLVAIIAGLTRIEDTVATSLFNAACRTPITGLYVAVIAGFKIRSPRFEILPKNPITTGR